MFKSNVYSLKWLCSQRQSRKIFRWYFDRKKEKGLDNSNKKGWCCIYFYHTDWACEAILYGVVVYQLNILL